MTIAVVGATGYTGSLIVRELVARGRAFVAVARNRDKLAALDGDFDRRVADAQDAEAVRGAIDGCQAIVSCVGPFVDLGEPTLQAAITAGVHYIDTTGEQAFMRTVYERYDTPAREAGIAVVPAIGFDWVPGDMAAAIAVRELGERVTRVDVYYLIRKAKASDGTKRTGMRVAAQPCLVWRDGSYVEAAMGGDERRFAFSEGEAHVALWPGGEPLTVPRHTDAPNVATYMRMPRAAAKLARGAKLAAAVGRTAVGSSTKGPSDEERQRGYYEIVAEARADDARTRCTVRGHDMYGMTAAACVGALDRITGPGYDRAGALAPAQAFEPEGFLGSLGDYLSWHLD